MRTKPEVHPEKDINRSCLFVLGNLHWRWTSRSSSHFLEPTEETGGQQDLHRQSKRTKAFRLRDAATTAVGSLCHFQRDREVDSGCGDRQGPGGAFRVLGKSIERGEGDFGWSDERRLLG